jgi:hypothetical protein
MREEPMNIFFDLIRQAKQTIQAHRCSQSAGQAASVRLDELIQQVESGQQSFSQSKVIRHKATGLFIGGFEDPCLVRLRIANRYEVQDNPLKEMFDEVFDSGEAELENMQGPSDDFDSEQPDQPSTVIGRIEDFEEVIINIAIVALPK